MKQRLASYRELRKSNFLDVQLRAKRISVELSSFNTHTYTLSYDVNGVTDNYQIKVKILGLTRKIIRQQTYKELRQTILDADIKVYCNCPAFKYWGFKYIGTVLGYGLYNESRFPEIRNPNTDGYVCKHLEAVMYTYPFNTSEIASQLKALDKDGNR